MKETQNIIDYKISRNKTKQRANYWLQDEMLALEHTRFPIWTAKTAISFLSSNSFEGDTEFSLSPFETI